MVCISKGSNSSINDNFNIVKGQVEVNNKVKDVVFGFVKDNCVGIIMEKDYYSSMNAQNFILKNRAGLIKVLS